MTQIIGIIALILFAAMMLVVGILSSKKATTLDGFLLGGRKLGAWLSAVSYGVTYFSAVIFIGYAGKHGWDIGFASMWIGVGNALIGSLLAWFVLADKTRVMTRRLNARTMPEFFGSRYGSKGMKIYASIIIFVFLVPYASTVYKGLGSLFGSVFPNDIFGISPTTACMFFVAILAAIYLVLGGYLASSISSLIQGIFMIVGIIFMCVAFATSPQVGGITNAVSQLGETLPKLTSITGGDSWSFLLWNILLTSFGTWGLPQMIHKYYAIKDKKQIPKGMIISTIFCLIIGCGAYFSGSLGRFFVEATETGAPVGGFDNIVPTMLNAVFSTNFIGNVMFSIILLCVLSASMSTLSAIVLNCATAVTVDIAGIFKKENVDSKKSMTATRVLCFIFVAISLVFALANFSIIVSLMSFSWGVVSGSFIGPYFWGLHSKKTTKAGAWAGILSGIVVFAVYYTLATLVQTIVFDVVLSGVMAMAVSFAIVPIVSKFTKKPEKDLVFNAFEKTIEA